MRITQHSDTKGKETATPRISALQCQDLDPQAMAGQQESQSDTASIPLQARLDRAARLGHHFGDIPVLTSTSAVQRQESPAADSKESLSQELNQVIQRSGGQVSTPQAQLPLGETLQLQEEPNPNQRYDINPTAYTPGSLPGNAEMLGTPFGDLQDWAAENLPPPPRMSRSEWQRQAAAGVINDMFNPLNWMRGQKRLTRHVSYDNGDIQGSGSITIVADYGTPTWVRNDGGSMHAGGTNNVNTGSSTSNANSTSLSTGVDMGVGGHQGAPSAGGEFGASGGTTTNQGSGSGTSASQGRATGVPQSIIFSCPLSFRVEVSYDSNPGWKWALGLGVSYLGAMAADALSSSEEMERTLNIPARTIEFRVPYNPLLVRPAGG